MKTDKKTRDVMTNRKNWLHQLLRKRNNDFGANRRDFIFIYYCTLHTIYSPTQARKMVLTINNHLLEPLQEDIINSIIRTVNAVGGYRITNQTIIDTLGITSAEIEELRIGHNLKAKAVRIQRQLEHISQTDKIIALYNEGNRITDIATMFPTISQRTIERIIQPYAKRKKLERDHTIWQLSNCGQTISAIATQVNCSKTTVQRVLNRTNTSNITITENFRNESDAPSFIDNLGYELFCRYKRETAQAVPEDYNNALNELQTTSRNVRIVGTGGTGKTKLIKDYLQSLPPNERICTLVVAPTGLAASHIDGLTVHKAFHLLNEVQTKELTQHIPQSLKKLHRVIIDEISMLRIDIFEQIITILQRIESQEHRHIQLILLGDFGQLEPVCTNEDRKLLRQFYPNAKGIYAFHSNLWDSLNFHTIVLKYNFRQNNSELSQQLIALKYGSFDAVRWFNRNCNSFSDERAVYICPKNEDVEKYNRAAMEQFDSERKTVFKAIYKEISPNTELPCPKELHLAVGMRIMTIINDQKYKNGSIGSILQVTPKSIRVLLDNGNTVAVHRKKFTLSDGSSYEQLPVILAYALTVHKCQGCTFDSVVIVPGFFAAGQLYTALSRCRSIDGICIDGTLTFNDLKIDLDALQQTI